MEKSIDTGNKNSLNLNDFYLYYETIQKKIELFILKIQYLFSDRTTHIFRKISFGKLGHDGKEHDRKMCLRYIHFILWH